MDIFVDEVRRFDKAWDTAAIKAPPLKLVGDNTAVLRLRLKRIRNLHLTIAPGRCITNDVENVGREYITPNDG